MRRMPDPIAAAQRTAEESEQATVGGTRGAIGLVLAPTILVAILLSPTGLEPPAHRLAAAMACVAVLWITEAIPLAATALLGPVLVVCLQIAPARDAFASFADPIIFLVLGGFILARGMLVHGVDRRLAYAALAIPGVAVSPLRLIVVYSAVCAAISLWISNTASTAMMFPIGLSIARHLERTGAVGARFATVIMLITAFAASIGGVGTPVGTATNLIGIGQLATLAGVRVTFFQWMLLGIPVVCALLSVTWLQLGRGLAGRDVFRSAGVDFVRRELQRLGPPTAAERNVLVAFAVAVTLWTAPGMLAVAGMDGTPFGRWYAAALPESVVALVGALLLFVLPIDWPSRRFTLTWDEAIRIDWGVLLLFGCGLTLGGLMFETGLARVLGEGVTGWLPRQTTATLTILFTAAAIVLSETTSNTASATMIVPIAIAVAQAAGVRPIEPALGATLGASMGFMLPISTPPNAIVYGSGRVPLGAMIRSGLLLDLAAFVVIVVVVLTVCPLAF
jgi:sodium-dependent dicarboxylate transporter 2/3/5